MLKPGDVYASVIRTAVPFLVGLLLSIPVVAKLGVDADTATRAVEFVVVTAYYALFRFLESHIDERFGWLLGLAKPPTYGEEPAEEIVDEEPLEGPLEG